MTINKTKLSIALGSALVVSMAASSVAVAAQNPFAMASLDKGYMVAAADTAKDGKMKEGKCGEGKCGEGKCGGEGHTAEGHCGADKAGEGKCGGDKAAEGKCGEQKAEEAPAEGDNG